MLSRVLSRLLVLAPLHLGLLKEPPLLRQPFPLLPILSLILPDKSLWRAAKNAFVLAEFTYPDVFIARRMVKVGVLLLDFALPRCECIYTTRGPLLLSARRLSGLLLRVLVRLRHVRTCLRSLRCEPSIRGGQRIRRAVLERICVLRLQCHAFGRIRLACKRELRLRRRVLLLEQTDVPWTFWRSGKRGGICYSG